MSIKDFFKTIDDVMDDWNSTSFTFYEKDYVPGLDADGNLTYGNGESKKGIELNTCVLYVDIRDSVALTEKHHIHTMGKVYSVFTHCVLLAAKEEGGFVRNIIGDRVMIVFPPEGCFTKAVNCAISINQIATRINERFKLVDFKCGIGIDFGKMNIMKVGILKRGKENDDNKGLVWIGNPANYASRLCDYANKTLNEPFYHVEGDALSITFFSDNYLQPPRHITKDYSKDELVQNLSAVGGLLHLQGFQRITVFEKKEASFSFEPILMSERVFKGFANANPDRNSVKNNCWKTQKHPIKDIDFVVYGGKVEWDLS